MTEKRSNAWDVAYFELNSQLSEIEHVTGSGNGSQEEEGEEQELQDVGEGGEDGSYHTYFLLPEDEQWKVDGKHKGEVQHDGDLGLKHDHKDEGVVMDVMNFTDGISQLWMSVAGYLMKAGK